MPFLYENVKEEGKFPSLNFCNVWLRVNARRATFAARRLLLSVC